MAAPILVYVGDDWPVGPVTLTLDGQPWNLTGCTVQGLVYAWGSLTPVATLTAGDGLTLPADLTTGTIDLLMVPRDVTATVRPQLRTSSQFPTRLALVVTDSQAVQRTALLVLFLPLDRRTDVPPS